MLFLELIGLCMMTISLFEQFSRLDCRSLLSRFGQCLSHLLHGVGKTSTSFCLKTGCPLLVLRKRGGQCCKHSISLLQLPMNIVHDWLQIDQALPRLPDFLGQGFHKPSDAIQSLGVDLTDLLQVLDPFIQ